MAYKPHRARTNDVATDGSISFESFQLSQPIMEGLADLGFQRPSPIQVQIVPIAKLGRNVIAQSKSGTGKTLGFAIPALESLRETFLGPQILVLSPTRELAAQTHSVISELGKHKTGLHCNLFIGGLSFNNDVRNLSPCNVIVGTPGRIIQLIRDGYLLTDSLHMFILDEADKMLQEGLMKQATLEILGCLPQTIQHICVSATYTQEMLAQLDALIPNPEHLLIATGNPTLEGVKQYYLAAPDNVVSKGIGGVYTWKFEKLVSILKSISFHQCIIFCNAAVRTGALVDKLNAQGWATRCISSQLNQKERLCAVEDFRAFRFRILLSSDLVARGLDIDRINLVINLDLPQDAETYLHRIGRTGRFGTFGVAINLLGPNDVPTLQKFSSSYQSSLSELPDLIPPDFYHYDLSEADQTAKEKLECAETKQRTKLLAPPAPRNKRKKPQPIEPEDEEDEPDAGPGNPHMGFKYFSNISSDASHHLPLHPQTQAPWHTGYYQPTHQLPVPNAPPPPPHPSEFWNPAGFVDYITTTYLPYLQSSFHGPYFHP